MPSVSCRASHCSHNGNEFTSISPSVNWNVLFNLLNYVKMEIVNRFSFEWTSLRPRISNSSKKILGSVNPIFLRRIGRGVHLTTSEIAYVGNTGRAALCCRDYIIFNFSMRATRLNPTITSNWSRLANILVVIRPCLWPRLV